MPYREIIPGKQLQPYVKHYYLFESDNAAAYTDTVFPVGSMEMIFNLGEGIWQFEENNRYYTTPQTEFWGQITRPLPIRSEGRHCMLGVRLYDFKSFTGITPSEFRFVQFQQYLSR